MPAPPPQPGRVPRTVEVQLPSRPPSSYRVVIGGEGAQEIAETARSLHPRARVAVIADEAVMEIARAVYEAAGGEEASARVFLFGGGEERKTRGQKKDLEDRLLEGGFGRDTLIVAVGGGVTCDLAGFVAATYHRGVPWLAMPTTLLAMVDAAVGGKVAVNTAHAKNLIGAFHHPGYVHCDPACLDSLPEREIRSGLAEVAKAALLEGEDRLARLAELAPRLLGSDRDAIEETIEAAVRTKAEVVARDAEEDDYRQILNLGHTIGHAVETASGWTLRHGEAMAVGLAVEARLAERAGIASRGLVAKVEGLMDRLGLPSHLPRTLDPARVYERLDRDKKVRGGVVRYALLERPGVPHQGADGWSVPVDDALVREILGL